MGSGARAEINDVIGNRNGFWFMFHHQHGVAFIAQLEQRAVHSFNIRRVQPGRGLIEDIGGIG